MNTMDEPERINDGGPAFPTPDVYHPNGQVQYGSNGMTLRDWFAGQALVALLGNNETLVSLKGKKEQYALSFPEAMTKYCYQAADAMLKERGNQ